MEKLTKALMTDETGQAIVTKLTALSGQMHELALATRGAPILFDAESDISVLGDGGYLAVYVGSTNPLVISGWTGDNSLVTGHLYYLIKSGTAVTSSDLGEYGGSAVTDTTLSVSGAPADAKAVGQALAGKADADDVESLTEYVADVKEDLTSAIDGMPFDIVQMVGGIKSKTHNGITFTPSADGKSCTVNGTATNTAFLNIFANMASLPEGIVPGKFIRFNVTSTKPDQLQCAVFYYGASGEQIGSTLYISTTGRVEQLPDNLYGIIIRIQVSKNATMSNDVISCSIYPEVYDNPNFVEFSEKIDTINEQLTQYNCIDVLQYATRANTTKNGVTYTWNSDGSCTVSGTATSSAYFDFFSSATSLPDWVEKGKTYKIVYDANVVRFRIFGYIDGVYITAPIYSSTQGGEVTIPTSISGIIIRLNVGIGQTANETVNPIMLTGMTNNELMTDSIINYYRYTGTDANNIGTNGWYFCDGTTVSNCPSTTRAFIIQTLVISSATMMQIAYDWTDGKRYYRRKQSSTWQDWIIFDDYENFIKNQKIYSDSDANSIATNSIYWCDGTTVSNCPNATHAFIIQTLVISAYVKIQVAINSTNGRQYYRKCTNDVWGVWSSGLFDIDVRYVAFGDSLTYGAVWIPNGSDKIIQRADEVNRIPTRIAKAIGCEHNFKNLAVGGMAYVPNVAHGTAEDSILDCIQDNDLSDVSFATIAGGRNDAYNTLGTSNSTAGDGTICGAIKQVIEYLRATYPFLEFVIIGCTPSATTNSEVWSKTYPGGWTLAEFDTQVSAICASYGVGYIDWKECQYVHHWADYTGVAGNYSHPNTQRAYLQMGNYAGGKVSKYYHGN